MFPRNRRRGSYGCHDPSIREYFRKYSDSIAQRKKQQNSKSFQEVKKDVAAQFNKKFQFATPASENKPPELPPLESLFSTAPYKVESLQTVKADLNTVKSRLNDFEISDWHQHTRRRSSLYGILSDLRHRISGEFVTQAFAKLYECVASYGLVPAKVDGEFCSVHLCEAPGAFITGLNHYLQLHRNGVKWRWFANTLNPYYEGNCLGNMITDDRFILHTLDSWCFGEDYTGDVMQRPNLDAIVRRSKEFPQVNLVTADGSIDCLDVPEAQEEHVSRLHLAEAVTALKMLGKGGSLVLKMFTFFEHCSVNLLYLLYACFEQLHVFKPCTSKPGNSEVYVIAKHFRKPDGIDGYLDRIFDNLHSCNTMFDVALLPEEFIKQVYECAYTFMCFQQDVIEHNIYYYQRDCKEEEIRLRDFKAEMCRHFFNTYKIGKIRPSEAILNGVDIVNGTINTNPRDNTGTYNERSYMSSMSGDLRLNMFKEKLDTFIDNLPSFQPRSKLSDRPFCAVKSCLETIQFNCGKTIKKLLSSKFAVITYVRFLTEVMEFFTYELHPQDEPPPLFTLNREIYTLTIDRKAYAALTCYDRYEQELFRILFKCITDLPLEEGIDHLVVENWLLLTQFSVGLVFFLKTYVFENIQRTAGTLLRFSRLKPDGIASLQYLNEALQSEQNRCSPTGSVLGIVPVPLLFEGGFYYAVMNYNDFMCLDYCERLLNK